MNVVSIFPMQSPRPDAGSLNRDLHANASGSIRWPRPIGSIPWPPRPTDGSSHTMYLNRLTLIGFIGGDAETKTISNGSTFTAFSVATQRSWKNSEGAWESRTEWHRCVSFGKLADFAATLKKGAHVQVEGELRGREYEKDGVKHRVFECRLESILKLDRAERRGADESDGPES